MDDTAKSRTTQPNLRLILFITGGIGLIIAAAQFDVRPLLRQVLEWISGLGLWAPVMYIAIYIAATVLLIPAWILTIGAGVVFGVLWGSVIVSIAATLGATAAFLIGRHLARGWVAKRLAGNVKFQAIDQAVAEEGWKIVGLMRLSPVVPYNVFNYALGITRVSLRDYFMASWIGMIPGTVLYVYAGSLAGSLANVGAAGRQRTTAEWVFFALGLVATLVVTVLVTRRAKAALNRKLPSNEQRKTPAS